MRWAHFAASQFAIVVCWNAWATWLFWLAFVTAMVNMTVWVLALGDDLAVE